MPGRAGLAPQEEWRWAILSWCWVEEASRVSVSILTIARMARVKVAGARRREVRDDEGGEGVGSNKRAWEMLLDVLRKTSGWPRLMAGSWLALAR